MSAPEVFRALASAPGGLAAAEVEARTALYGPNELPVPSKRSPWLLFLDQFRDVMILILLAAAVVSAALGDVVDAFVIAAIVLLNAVIGFVQTYRAEKALDALKKMGTAKATVFRDGASTVLDASELVPGDVVQLEAGNAVPADMRLFDAHALKVDESALTGESVPVDKRTEALADSDSPLGDRLNMAYKGTLVANGRARAVVVATGTRTELGKIADLLGTETTDTPLKKRMAAFGRKLTYLILLVSAIVFLAGWLRGEEPVQMLLTAIGLSVAAIPESLPALLTVGLAMGAARMASQKALVRHLPAVETLGSVSFICTDKTGTLTLNEMRAARLHVHRSPYWDLDHLPLHLAMALNHDVELDKGSFRGEPTEAAIVKGVLAEIGEDTYRHLVDCFPRLSELPFDADRRCMTTVHQFGDRILLLGKGAPEAIAALLESGEEAAELDRTARQWAAEGLRVLAFGYRLLDALPGHMVSDELEKEFRWAGLVGLMDPPREKVGPAIGQCRTAGIRPVMITGDHPATACAIAADIGILTGSEQVLSGAQLDRLDKAAFAAQVENTAVYARVSPEQKLRIVRALQAKGHFVAMTGDGVNDAPSLKAADIGVAMGINGTDVSKEAAEMVLLDDDFATIVKAVEEGRRIYDNIRKFVRYILTCNSAEVWIILLAPLVGMPMPLLPIQILWINLVTDGLPGIALANETPEKDLMRRPPRPPRESLFSQGLGFHILWVGLLMAGLTLGIQAWALGTGREHWQTMVFTSLSFLQMAHALAVRSERSFVFQVGFFSNPFLLASVSATLLLQLAVVYVPFLNPLFNTSPLSLIELSVCVAVAAILFHAVECEKWVKR